MKNTLKSNLKYFALVSLLFACFSADAQENADLDFPKIELSEAPTKTDNSVAFDSEFAIPENEKEKAVQSEDQNILKKDLKTENQTSGSPTVQSNLDRSQSDLVLENEIETTNPSGDAGNYIVDERVGTGEVVVERPYDYSLPYKQRRTKHGALFSVFTEKFRPEYYESLHNDTPYDQAGGGADIPLAGVEIGYKFNFKLGSIAALANYASGKIATADTTAKYGIEIKKWGVSANYAMDNFFNEPWVVPYGQVGIHQFTVVDQYSAISTPDNVSEQSGTAGISLNYKFGLLFQLDWLDKSTHTDGLRSSGMENTFLDIYMAWYNPAQTLYDKEDPSTEGDSPDLRSSARLGVGLKIEF